MQNCEEHIWKICVLQIRIHFSTLVISEILLATNFSCVQYLKYYEAPYCQHIKKFPLSIKCCQLLNLLT
jgi:hypothetical protein